MYLKFVDDPIILASLPISPEPPATNRVSDLLPGFESYLRVMNPMRSRAGEGERKLLGPKAGTIDADLVLFLVEALEGSGTKFGHCLFLQWEGYSDFPRGPRDALSVVVGLDRRRMQVLEGTLADIVADARGDLHERVPTWWLPADGAWACGNNIYSKSIYFGVPESVAARILEDPRIDAMRVPEDAPVEEEYI